MCIAKTGLCCCCHYMNIRTCTCTYKLHDAGRASPGGFNNVVSSIYHTLVPLKLHKYAGLRRSVNKCEWNNVINDINKVFNTQLKSSVCSYLFYVIGFAANIEAHAHNSSHSGVHACKAESHTQYTFALASTLWQTVLI